MNLMLPSSTNAPATRLTRHRSLTDWLVQLALPLAALMLLGFAGWYVWNSRMVADNPPPPIAPAQSPFAATLAAAGIVEAQTENIAVPSRGSPRPRASWPNSPLSPGRSGCRCCLPRSPRPARM
ncbi:MAG: hypothetical protein EBZ13_14195 [Planctomycetia bacterium]|nr:hypothetical protein [Planctomycetia bacterium]